MSTEATGDGEPAGAGAVGPDEDATTAEPTATAVAEPTVTAVPEPTAAVPYQAAPVEAAPVEAAVPAEAAEAGEGPVAEASGPAGEAYPGDEAGWTDEADEFGEDGESREDEPGGVDGYESDEDYDDYPDDEVADGDEALEYDEDYDGDDTDDTDESDETAEPRRARRWPRVLLGFGFVVLALAIVGGAIAIVGTVTHGFKKPVKVTYKKSAVFSLKTGDCLDPQGQSYTLIACDSPHVAEVFGTFALAGTAWPGDAAVQTAASSGCASRLTAYLNPQLAISLSSTYVYPDSVAWQAGTRTVICEVRASSGELTGSVRGATATAS
jgi:hypothetical protein